MLSNSGDISWFLWLRPAPAIGFDGVEPAKAEKQPILSRFRRGIGLPICPEPRGSTGSNVSMQESKSRKPQHNRTQVKMTYNTSLRQSARSNPLCRKRKSRRINSIYGNIYNDMRPRVTGKCGRPTGNVAFLLPRIHGPLQSSWAARKRHIVGAATIVFSASGSH